MVDHRIQTLTQFLQKLLIILLVLAINACAFIKKDGIEINIINNSSDPITSLEFTTIEKLEFIEIDGIAPNDSAQHFLSMTNNKIDGSYSLTFKRVSGEIETVEGGYYTNGKALDQRIIVEVEDDTTYMKFEGNTF